MKPLIILVITFITSLLVIFFANNHWDYILAGNIAMCIMLCFTSIGHFVFYKGMAMMIPTFIPFKNTLVFFTGIFEIIAGILLLFKQFRPTTGWMLIIFFILILPANIHAAIKKVNHEKSDHKGKGIKYLWFRIPLQVFFIVWVYSFSIQGFN